MSGVDLASASLEVLHAMDRNGIRPLPRTLSELFRCYCHGPDDARMLQRHLRERYPHNYWTESVWEAAIFACATTTTENDSTAAAMAWETAMEFYSDLRKDHSRNQQQHQQQSQLPSERIYVSMFHVCAVTKNVTQAMTFLDVLLQEGDAGRVPLNLSPRLWGAVLKVCAAAGDSRAAHGLLQRMSSLSDGRSPNVRHYTYYLKALVVNGQCQAAVEVLEWMHYQSCSRHKSMRSGDLVTKDIGPGPVVPEEVHDLCVLEGPDMAAVKIVLEGCAAAGNFTLSRRILGKVKDGSFGEELANQLDAHCYHTVLTACRDPEHAKELVREMRLSRRNRYNVVPPNQVTFTKAITVCRKARDVESARFFLSSAKSDGIEPDVYMYTAGAC